MEYLIRLVTRPGGVVLDPFMGSGSTGVAAVGLGMEFRGFELEKKYFGIAQKRLEKEAGNAKT
jgi:site-specific DNA-methyltransferase (adenine-specific)